MIIQVLWEIWYITNTRWKVIIGLFRFYLGFDTFYEEVNQLELAQILAKEKAQKEENKTPEAAKLEEKINEMDIEGC